MHYLTFLAALHDHLKPQVYFEIGIRRGASLKLAQGITIGVDPRYELDYQPSAKTHLFRETSDAFFSSGKIEAALGLKLINLAFIDGWHNSEFALRDFINTERYCDAQGAIVFNDVRPRNEDEAVRKPHGRAWTGDVWKVSEVLERYRPDLKLTYVNSSPTGMLVVQGLNPSNQRLSAAYQDIEQELTASTAPLMPPAGYKERYIEPSDALNRIINFVNPGAS